MTKTFDVLNLQEEISGNYLLEASAGTGKTFTIAHLVVRLVLESEFAFSIKRIGVVTFTKASANELFERIHALLQSYFELVKQRKPLPIYDLNYPQESFLHRLQLALYEIHEASITTIHGFCFQILKRYGLKWGSGLAEEPSSDTPLEILVYNHVKQKLSEPEILNFICKTQKRILLSRYKGNLHQLITSIGRKVLNESLVEPQKIWNDFAQEIKQAISNLPSIPSQEKILSYGQNFKISPLTQNEFTQQIPQFIEAVHAQDCEFLIEKNLFFHYFEAINLKKKVSSFDENTESFFQDFSKCVLPVLQAAQHASSIELMLIEALVPSWKAYLKEKRLFSFQGILETLNSYLSAPSNAYEVHKDFDAFIIDEFQDTDPLQWQIIKSLFVNHPVKAFYMVGDPKQAIYAFRAADIYTYVQVKNEVLDLKVKILDSCFRSSKSLISALNDFFLKTSWIELPFMKTVLEYTPVKAGNQSLESKSPSFLIYDLQKDQTDTELAMVNLCLTLQKQYPEDTIAILAKDRFQISNLESALKEKGAVFQSHKSESFSEHYTYNLLKELSIFLASGYSYSSLKTFLGSGFFELPTDWFFKEKCQEFCLFWSAPLDKIQHHYREHGIIAALEALFDLVDHHGTLIRYSLMQRYGSFICDTLFYIAHEAENQDTFSISSFQLRLELLQKSGFVLPNFSNPSAKIILMTSHMSKGLEFDHVICLGMATRHDPSQSFLIKRIHNQLYIGTNQADPLSMTALHNLDAEKLRQLYVSLTRAKKTVHLPLIAYGNTGLKLGSLSPFEYFILKTIYPSLSYTELYNQAACNELIESFKTLFCNPEIVFHTSISLNEPQISPFYVSELKKDLSFDCVTNQKTLSFTSLKQESIHYVSEEPLRGHEFGDFFHNLIEFLLHTQSYRNPHSAEFKTYLEKFVGLSDFHEHCDLIYQYALFCFTYKFSTVSLSEIPYQDLYIEQSFSYQTEDGIMKGFIDCVVVHEQKLYFFDWKTTSLSKEHLENMDLFMKQSSYHLQIKIYENAIKFAQNYFPGCQLEKAFYVFVKHKIVFESSFETLVCP